jgi:hypothetical protein
MSLSIIRVFESLGLIGLLNHLVNRVYEERLLSVKQ